MTLPSFFDAPEGPAVLKHGLLRRYLHIFANKTGGYSPGRRVVYVDGYAGAGRYRDGTAGSPTVARDVANALAGVVGGQGPRNLDCVFVEEDPKVRAELLKHVPQPQVRGGRIQDHLDEILERAEGVPLFLFLDPYGMTLDVETITEQILNRHGKHRRLATEVLVNFASHAIRREGGHLFSTNPSPAAASIVAGMDRFLDGDWWRELWGKSPEADRAIAEGWAERISARAPDYDTLPMGVPTSWQGDPLYYLALVSAHAQGGWFFADALRGSLTEFYRFTVGDRPQLFDPDYLADVSTDMIMNNLLRLISERGPVTLGEVTRELYGDALGFAGIKEVRRAVKTLYGRDQVDHNGVGDLHEAVVGPGRSLALFP